MWCGFGKKTPERVGFFPKMNGYHFVISRKNNQKSNPFWKNLRFITTAEKNRFSAFPQKRKEIDSQRFKRIF
jgi:hypothetical protein